MRRRMRAGEESRVIDLPGDRRTIETVDFWYEKGNWGPERPRVSLFGLH